jgi:hyaluronate lyase
LSFYISASSGKDDFEKIIANRKEALTGTKNNKKNPTALKKAIHVSTEGQSAWDSMDKLLWRTFLWKDIGSESTVENIIANCLRLKTLSQALITPGSKLEKNKKLKNDILFALNWLFKNQYNEQKLQSLVGNPDHYKIAALITDVLIILDEDFSSEQKENIKKILESHISLINQNPGHKLEVAPTKILIGALSQRKKMIDSASQTINKEIKYFFEVGGLRDSLPGTQSIELLYSFSQGALLLAGTSFQVSNSINDSIFSWIVNSFLPLTYHNRYLSFDNDIVSDSPYKKGSEYTQILHCLLNILPNSTDPQTKEVAKYMLQQAPPEDIMDLDFKSFAVADVILSSKKIEALKHAPPIKFYDQTQKAIVQTPSFAFAADLLSGSIRISDSTSMETEPTGPSLPGTNINLNRRKRLLQARPEWIGGVAANGNYAALGVEIKSGNVPLSYKKSWFVFDNEIVAIGSSIKSSDDGETETVIENIENIDGNLISNNNEELVEKYSSEDLEWLLMKKNPADSLGRGIFFPVYQKIKIRKEGEGQNQFTAGNKNDSLKKETYFKLSLNHGKRPLSATYQYVILPSFSERQMRFYNDNPEVVVLEINDKVHAVKDSKVNAVAANFWTTTHTELSVDGSFVIISDCQASIFCHETEEAFELILSDPTLKNEGIIKIDLVNKPLAEIQSKDEAVNVEDFLGAKRINFNMKGSNGKGLKIVFKIIRPIVEN